MERKPLKVQEAIQKIHEKNFTPVYLVLGTEEYLQKQIRTAFLESFVIEEGDLNFSQFDMEEDSLGAVLDEAESVPFFGDQRLIFVETPYFLTAEKKTNAPEQPIDSFLDYLKQPIDSSILVFFANYEKLDERKKVVKQLKKASTIIEVQPLKEAEVRRYLQQTIDNEGIFMSREAFELFIRLTDADLSKSMREFDKIKLFATESKKVTVKDIEQLVPKTLEHNIFDLTNDLLAGNAEKALRLYEDLHTQGEETIKINAILISQIRLLLQTAILTKNGYTQGDITKTIGAHPYRVKLAVQQLRKLDINSLSSIYDELIENDYLVKSGQAEKEFTFQLFLLKTSAKQKRA